MRENIEKYYNMTDSFFKIMVPEMNSRKDVTASAKLIFHEICSSSDDFHPSLNKLQKRLGLSKQACVDGLANLVKINAIERLHHDEYGVTKTFVMTPQEWLKEVPKVRKNSKKVVQKSDTPSPKNVPNVVQKTDTINKITINKDNKISSRKPESPNDKITEFVELWNRLCNPLPRVVVTSKGLRTDRLKKLKARLKEKPALEYWESVITKFATGWPGILAKKWANFDYLIRNSENHQKIADDTFDLDRAPYEVKKEMALLEAIRLNQLRMAEPALPIPNIDNLFETTEKLPDIFN